MSGWVALAQFNHPFEAQALRAKLESEEIPCFIANENIVGINPLYSLAVGGVQVMVPPEELERAKRILERDEGVLDDV